MESEYIPLLEFLGYDAMGATIVANLPAGLQVAFATATCLSDLEQCGTPAPGETLIPYITNNGAKTSDNPTAEEIDTLNSICVLIRTGISNA